MIITFQCQFCKTDLEVESDEMGDESPCPSCGEQIMIPAPGVAPGSRIGGFEIVRKIGTGGMGEVFLARQLAMDRSVALKILSPAMKRNPAVIQRFLHEVRVAAQLEHPNIVAAFDAGEDAGYNYMAMSLVQGKDLDDIVRETGPLPESQCLHIALKVAEALDYAWRKYHLLHRDIKPSNIMIDETGDVKLMDMGIAKRANEDSGMTIQGMLIGTPYYMSPEQAQCLDSLDCRADIYSLGATLYWMLTGTRPFDGSTVMGVIAKVLKDPIPPPGIRNPALSDGVCDLLFATMAKDRDDRPADWSALIEDIKRVQNKQGPKTIALRHPMAGGLPKSGNPELAELAMDPNRTMLAADPDSTMADMSGPSVQDHMGTRALRDGSSLGGSSTGKVGGSRSSVLDTLPVNPELPSGLRTMLTMIATLVLVALIAGVAVLFMKYLGARDDRIRAAQQARNSATQEEALIIGDIEANLSRHQMFAKVEAEEKKRQEGLKRMWDYAVANLAENPTEIHSAIEKFDEIRIQGYGTEYQLRADDQLRKLRQAEQGSQAGYEADLRRRVADLSARHRYVEILELLHPDATTPFAEQTRGLKLELARGVVEKQRGLALFLDVAEPTVPQLLQFQFAEARQQLAQGARGPGRALAMPFAEDALRDYAYLDAMEAEVATAIGSHKGRSIDLTLRNRREPVKAEIVGASGKVVDVVIAGKLQQLGMRDLHPGEVYGHLRQSTAPGANCMRALAALSLNHPNADAAAASVLAHDHSMLALLLRAESDRRRLAGDWVAAEFSGDRYLGEIGDFRVTFTRQGAYTVAETNRTTSGTYSLRDGAVYLTTQANRLPKTWGLEWADGSLNLSPRDGLRIRLTRADAAKTP